MTQQLDSDQIKVSLEAWKTVVGVQQHFNTIEMQIRSMAITVVTATVGAAVFARGQSQQALLSVMTSAKPYSPRVANMLWNGASAPKLLILAAMVAWSAFYLMDRWWYHLFLKASVDQATAIEKIIEQEMGYDVLGLSAAISARSPLVIFGVKIDSSRKINIFYGLGLFVLLFAGLML